MSKGIIETLQDKVIELQAQNASLQQQVFMLATAMGYDLQARADAPAAVAKTGQIDKLDYTVLGLVNRKGVLYRPEKAPKVKAPPITSTADKLASKELSGEDIGDDLEELE